MARQRHHSVPISLSRGDDASKTVAGRQASGRADAELLLDRESILRNRIRAGPSSGLAACSPDRNAPDFVPVQRALMSKLSAEAYAIIEGRPPDPFHYLGLHSEDGHKVVRAFLPEASNVEAIGEHRESATLDRIHDAGLFSGTLPNGSTRYQLRARFGDNVVELEDPYRFPPVLTDFDLYLLGEGTDQRLYDKLGAHPMTLAGVGGVAFVVLAPTARRVSVVGDFNFWDSRRHPMRVRGVGYWELFIPRARAGDHYKFAIIGQHGQQLPLKSDPMAFATEMRPSPASIVLDEKKLPHPQPAPSGVNALSAPMSIYEVHLGSWRRKGNNEWLTYRDLADQLPRYVRDLGFT